MKQIVAIFAAVWVCVLAAAVRGAGPQVSQPAAAGPAGQSPAVAPAQKSPERALLDRYCVGCHNQRTKTANLTLDMMNPAGVAEHAEAWEKVVRKLRGGLMPPTGLPRPDEATRDNFVAHLENALDGSAAANPNPGRTETFHRLNRAEYHNAVRDILALDIDVASLLPGDSASYGFDNIAGVLKVSESLMERYLSAARKISRAAIGSEPPGAGAQTYAVSPGLLQDDRVDGLPFGTRGGTIFTHIFPRDAEYTFRFDLANLSNAAELEFMLDGERVKLFTIKGGGRSTDADGNEQNENLEVRMAIKAGPREVAATFLKAPTVLAETNRRPFINPTVSRSPNVALRSITITGPFNSTGAGDTPSRRRIFACQPASAAAEPACAKTILSALARRGFRRPVSDDDIRVLLTAYNDGRAEGATFEAGIERGVQQLLVSPEFLFRVAAEPARAGAPYRVSDIELASRLSFFLWSSVPDDELIDLAAKGQLKNPAVVERQVRRMIADPRSEALTANFAGQWLQLRNVAVVKPSEVLFPDFDDTLRQGFKRETELFFDSVLREDRSALDLLTADYTFLNDRLARHYGIPNVKGSHFRRVALSDQNRRGLLGQGSILTMTSQPVRTSPVFRGKWILDNILGTPPPDPPPNVPPLPEKNGAYAGRAPSMRERMAEHRANATCATCHSMIDPLGFGLENFDPTGKWRDVDEMFGRIDASGNLPDGTKFGGAAELRAVLVKRPDRFVSALTEKLLTYALGRGVEYYDMPAVRKIVNDAAASRYQLSNIVLGIVRSMPFQMRRADAGASANQD
jgi:cytochrome c5